MKKIVTGTKQAENIERGIKKFNTFFGENEQIFPSFREVSSDFADYCAGFIYGDLFQRKGIDDKTRFLAIIGSLIGQGNTGIPLKRYIFGALKAGWTKDEITEVIMILAAYAGYPSAVVALYTAEEAFAAFEKNPNDSSAI
jgi:4-carboxymuconolactone decarboxylase